jgi:prepilin-type N-terminal cleavage/methylation domain-containing protein
MNELQPLAVKPKQGGYTIVELSIALTIIAILIVSGIVGITSVLRSNKANTQLEDSGRTLTRLQAYVSTTASTIGLTTAGGVGLGLFPSTRVFSSTSVFNAFGTTGTASEFVNANSTASTDHNVPVNTGAIYTLTAIPTQVCADIAVGLANLADSIWVSSAISAVATTVTAGHVVKAPGAALNLANLGTQCSTGSTVGMSFVVRP